MQAVHRRRSNALWTPAARTADHNRPSVHSQRRIPIQDSHGRMSNAQPCDRAGVHERGGSSLCDVPSAPVEAYVAAFVARCEVMQRTEQAKIDRPGLDGFVSCSDERQVENRLLVIDDRAFDAVVELLSDARAGSIRVFQQAARCAQLLNQHPAWKPEVSTAMVCATCTPCPAPGCQTS